MPPKGLASVTGLVILIASAPGGLGQAGTQERAPTRFTFNWPVPATGTVTEKALKKGKVAELRYVVKVTRHTDKKSLAVQLEDFEFLRIMGMDATKPELKRALAPALAIASAVPAIRVDRTGAVQEVEEIRDLMKRMFDFMKKQGSEDPATIAQVEKMFANPQVAAMVSQMATQFWATWVEAWLVEDPPGPGKSDVYVMERPAAEGKNVRSEMLFTNHGPSPDHPGHVKLSVVEVLEGDAAKALLLGVLKPMLGEMVKAGKARPGDLDDAFETIRIRSRQEVVTDPKTLLPVWALSQKIVEIKAKGEPKREETERKEYRFSWKR